jgi:phytol kinase
MRVVNLLENNFLALVITLAAALIWLRINDFAAHRGWISSQVSRKIIHAGTGPLFVLCWLLFDADPINRYLAALVPGLITIQFALIGLGVIKDQASVDAMSRSGDRREILRGPLFYGIIFVILTIVYWKDSPVGIVALMMLCGGDGLADIFGRRYGANRLPWSAGKSWSGTIAMFAGGFVFALVIVAVFVSTGVFSGPLTPYIYKILLIAVVATAVESLPFHDIDNVTVALSAVLVGHLLF